MSLGKSGDELSESEFFRRRGTVDQDVAVGTNAPEDVFAFQKRAVLHEHHIGLLNRFTQADFFFIDAGEGNHGRAGAFGAEARERLRPMAFSKGRHAEHFGGGNDALPSAAVDSDLIHDVFSMCRCTRLLLICRRTRAKPRGRSRFPKRPCMGVNNIVKNSAKTLTICTPQILSFYRCSSYR